MNTIHDTYEIKMRDGKILFVEVSLTQEDANSNPEIAGYQKLLMSRIFSSVKESGYNAVDIEVIMPINSTDPKAREVINNSIGGMKRLGDFFKLGGEAPDKE